MLPCNIRARGVTRLITMEAQNRPCLYPEFCKTQVFHVFCLYSTQTIILKKDTSILFNLQPLQLSKGNGKAHSITGHEGPEEE